MMKSYAEIRTETERVFREHGIALDVDEWAAQFYAAQLTRSKLIFIDDRRSIMAEKKEANHVNPLISDNPRDTLTNCASALSWLTLVSDHATLSESIPSENASMGRKLLETCILNALTHEAAQAPAQRS